MSSKLLSIQDLHVVYKTGGKIIPAVRGVSLSIEPKQTLGLVGESGCGKSTLALSIMNLLPKEESQIRRGIIKYKHLQLNEVKETNLKQLRGKDIAMIFQEPFSSLNPVLTIDYQIQEIIILDAGKPNRQRARDLFDQVSLSDPDRILDSYPHQLSGGQRQRVMIAMAIARKPSLLIADEPTTALDVTIQADIIALLKKLKNELNMSMLFVTHNFGLVKEISDTLAVMYAGQIVEQGLTKDILSDPQHPYTQGLLESVPKIQQKKAVIPVVEGYPPDPTALPQGCPFHPRCKKGLDICHEIDPRIRMHHKSQVRCHLYEA